MAHSDTQITVRGTRGSGLSPTGGRIQTKSQCEQAPEHGNVGLLDWAQHKIVDLREEEHTDGVHREVHEPLVFQKEAQDCRDRSPAAYCRLARPHLTPRQGDPIAGVGSRCWTRCYLGHPQQ